MESCDICLDDGYGTRDEEGIDGRQLIIERFLDTFRSVEYEDDWRVINFDDNNRYARLTQTERRNVI